ncbi:MAG TPA: histidine triad nucleotide-binding protein [bacterium]|nr:histidine triad nucleotide-binding protein [bacterium]
MNDCIFCRIARGDIPAKKVIENDRFVVFHDISPLYKVHLLIVPKRHIASVNDVDAASGEALAEIFGTAREAAEKVGVAGNGYRLTVNTGRDAGQVVHHFHMHLLAGEPLRPL